ncbi:MAG: malto-oligosyltrehalose synthase [Chloroflexi bacterium]|nr:malto-oligosyltrehalose synthase [Chloroflexota bacterium]
MLAQRRVPSAVYRLQFNHELTFRDAQALVPYVHDLGISDCYASPLLKARPGSCHGYDICDHSQLNPEVGTDEEFEAFSSALRAHEMGLVLDTVANHMCIVDSCNLWWMHVLENGPGSVFASHFDVDWHPATPELDNKVLIPILEDQYGKVLERGKLRLAYEDGAFFVHYHTTKLPVDPGSYGSILGHQLTPLSETLGEDHEHIQELRSILTALSYLPPRFGISSEKMAERNREKEVIKRRIAALCTTSPEVQKGIDASVGAFNGTPGDPRSFDLLDALLDMQAYRLAYWRVAAEEINYRRFFDINDLAAIRVELPEVFQAAHQLLLKLLTEGKVTGLRIDHPDGLWNPASYFRQVQEGYIRSQARARLGRGTNNGSAVLEAKEDAVVGLLMAQEDRSYGPAPIWPLYVVAEKILAGDEPLPQNWAVYGTTGYDFLNAVNGLFVDARRARVFDRIYSRFTGEKSKYRILVNSSKKMIMLVSLVAEINALSHQLERIAKTNRRYRDFTLNSLTFAIREVIANLPVYRTYITDQGEDVARSDQGFIQAAVRQAKKQNPRTAKAIFDFIQDCLLLRNVGDFHEEDKVRLTEFAMKFQQLTGPVMAKAVEDTAFYVFNRLASLNEVGGNPDQFGVSVEDFHRQNAERRLHWPHSLITTSTHDTKRSEDVRARIDVLSEIPDEWQRALASWSRLNAPSKTVVDGDSAPDRNDEYLLYQTLVGAWPNEPMRPEQFECFRERIADYMLKATREAKTHTSWINPNEEYEAALRNFVFRLLEDGIEDPFRNELLRLQRQVAYYGRFNSLSQVLLKLTSPGVPDIYQGNELWDFSLVDPDNRRPVDYRRRRALLAELTKRIDQSGEDLGSLAGEVLREGEDGRIKLYVTYRTLNFRRAHRQLFASGEYWPVEAEGEMREHAVAFARILGTRGIVVVAPRLVVGLTGGIEQPPVGGVWRNTSLVLPLGTSTTRYRNIFTGETLVAQAQGDGLALRLAEVLGNFPVALLEGLER